VAARALDMSADVARSCVMCVETTIVACRAVVGGAGLPQSGGRVWLLGGPGRPTEANAAAGVYEVGWHIISSMCRSTALTTMIIASSGT